MRHYLLQICKGIYVVQFSFLNNKIATFSGTVVMAARLNTIKKIKYI